MKFNSKFNSLSVRNHTFDNIDTIICFLQDIVHIGTKLRNRLLTFLAFVLIGNKIASVSHLKMLINVVSEDVHGLVYSDICPDDRQNFGSLQKIMEPKVRVALEKYIVDSEGTIEYIRICQEITSSLYDDNLTPLERIFLIWRPTFFLRACRLFITGDHTAKLSDNFITQNAYECIELNAKNLVILTKKFRDEGLKKLFIPTIFNSQPCEETFRKMRSMGTINYTKINFTLLELLHLIGRVELMNDIMCFKLADADIFFPRNPLKRSSENQFDLPSDSDIERTISRALAAAVEDAKKFGINVNQDDVSECALKNVPSVVNQDAQDSNDTFVDLGIACDDKLIEYENSRNYSEGNESPDEDSSFVNVVGSKGSKPIRKAKLIWSLSDSKEKLSSDRLRRVRGSSTKKNPRRQLEFVDVSVTNQPVYQVNEIKIGDWCVFKNVSEKNENRFLLGNIISFRYVDGKTRKDKIYCYDFAPVKLNSEKKKSREIETLASWYEMKLDGETPTFKHIQNSFIRMQFYVANLSIELIEKSQSETIGLSKKYSKSIRNLLQCFQ